MAGGLGAALDRVVGVFAPERARDRMVARLAIDALGGYNAGSRSRRETRDWFGTGGSANADTLPDLVTMRGRSRDLARNAPLAGGAINRMVTHVVGTGLRVVPTVDAAALGVDETVAERFERDAAAIFGVWASEPQWCDRAGVSDFAELTEIAFRSALESGDSFAWLRQVADGAPLSTRVALYEADQVCNPQGRADGYQLRNGRRVYAGVEVGAGDRPAAYWFRSTHPGALPLAKDRPTWSRVAGRNVAADTANVVHLFHKLRPGQARGLPVLAPVVEAIKQLARYSDAEVWAAVISATFAVKTVTPDGKGFSAPGQSTNASADTSMTVNAGTILDLAPGEDLTSPQVGRPNPNFEGFFQAVVRQIGGVLEIPFEVLIQHFTRSYSAARAALLQAWQMFRRRRVWLANRFCQPIYSVVIYEAVARGYIDAPGFLDNPVVRRLWLGSEWIGDAPGQLDPVKETDAAERRVAAGFSTGEREAREINGTSYAANLKQRGREIAEAQRAGVALPAPKAATETPLDVDPEDTDPGDTDPDDNDEGETDDEN